MRGGLFDPRSLRRCLGTKQEEEMNDSPDVKVVRCLEGTGKLAGSLGASRLTERMRDEFVTTDPTSS